MSRNLQIFALLNLTILIVAGAIFGVKFFVSSIVSALFFCLIIRFSMGAYESKIYKELASGKYDDLQDLDDEISPKDTFKNKKIKPGFFTFFSPFKLVLYTLFVLSLYALVKFGYFSVLGTFFGVILAQISAFVYGVRYGAS
ncbi:MAG: hypothetical protein MR902_07245 [Campylobacter sp.]|nr:hypothetical protein [Campylobacter sp.]